MARPAKSIKSATGARTTEEIDIRTASEEKLKGGTSALKAPKYFTSSQKAIFKFIVDNLKDAEILGNLDLYILNFSCVTIDKMIDIDTRLNQIDPVEDVIEYKSLVTTRSILAKDFFRCINELSLSPQARAKLSIANVKAVKESKNPLLEALEL